MSSGKSLQIRSWGKKKSARGEESSLRSAATLVSSGSSHRCVGPFIWDRLVDQDDSQGSSLAVDIVFVHGLRGHFLKTWSTAGKNGANVFWPGDLLREDIREARVISWGYDAMAATAEPASTVSQNSIFGHAGSLLNDLADKRKSDPKRPILWVGHSLGGLVIKEAIIRAANSSAYGRDPRLGDIYSSTIGVIFMGTPHRGSPRATLGESAARLTARLLAAGSNMQVLGNLRPDSHALEKQLHDFVTVSSHIPVVCFYEELKTGRAGLIVPKASAVYDGSKVSFDGIPADHREMARFASRSDIGYNRVLGHIQSIWGSYRDEYRRKEEERIGEEREREEEQKKKIKEAEQATLEDFILARLRFSSMSDREDRIEEAHRGTLDWVFVQDPPQLVQAADHGDEALSFSDWLSTNGQPVFWVSGKAGSGKSTLMKSICRHQETLRRLSQWAESRPLLICQFFIYELGIDLGKCREGMLRSILCQLFASDRGLELAKSVFPGHFLNVTPDDHIQGRRAAFWIPNGVEWIELTKYFDTVLRAIKRMDWRLCLFVDGLDEYRTVEKWKKKKYTEADLEMVYEGEDGDDVWGSNTSIMDDHRQVLAFFKDLCAHPNIKLCLSSRELMIFEDGLAKFPRLRMQDCTKNDITRFVWDQISQTDIGEDEKRTLTTKITSKSCGVFLWVRLVVNSILDGYACGDSVSRLHEKIDEAPSRLCGPRGLFTKMIQPAIKDHHARLESSRIFRMMGTRFGNLHRVEAECIWYGLESYRNHKGHCELVLETPTDFTGRTELERVLVRKEARRMVKGRSGNLLECETTDYKVVYMHYSVQQFIHRKAIWDNLFPPDPDFVPILALLSSTIIQIKKYDKEAIGRDEIHPDPYRPNDGSLTHYFFQAMIMARTADPDHGDNPLYIKLIDELDKTMSEIYRRVPISQSNHCYWPHNSRPFYDNFLLNAAHWDLGSYIKWKMCNSQDQASTKPLSQKLLQDLIYMRSHYLAVLRKPDLVRGLEHNHPYGDCWWGTDETIVLVLIQLGADPKLVWDQFLSLGYAIAFTYAHPVDPSSCPIHCSIDAIKGMESVWELVLVEMLILGADPFRLVEITCEHWNLEEALPAGKTSLLEVLYLIKKGRASHNDFLNKIITMIENLNGKAPKDQEYFQNPFLEFLGERPATTLLTGITKQDSVLSENAEH